MDLMTDEINKLRQEGDLVRSGKMDLETAKVLVCQHKVISSHVGHAIKLCFIECSTKLAKQKNIIDHKHVIDVAGSELQMIECPYSDNFISRAECLDYSGSHIEDCSSCPQKKLTNDLLLSD